ncbi:MAG: hypothetical protein KME27_02575 [Lyngbya sp. HA4199-MV5]|nr:hypothetical protein [Lyngbya sp. HA4199-MV5]
MDGEEKKRSIVAGHQWSLPLELVSRTCVTIFTRLNSTLPASLNAFHKQCFQAAANFSSAGLPLSL